MLKNRMVVNKDAPEKPIVPFRESEEVVCIIIGVVAVVAVSRCPDEVVDDDNNNESFPPNMNVRIDCTNVSGLYI